VNPRTEAGRRLLAEYGHVSRINGDGDRIRTGILAIEAEVRAGLRERLDVDRLARALHETPWLCNHGCHSTEERPPDDEHDRIDAEQLLATYERLLSDPSPEPWVHSADPSAGPCPKCGHKDGGIVVGGETRPHTCCDHPDCMTVSDPSPEPETKE
jgi:hypothetical protein